MRAAPRPYLDRRTLWTLLAGNALTEIGILFFLPILPLFVRSRGGSPLLVGTIFASGVIARALAQYPAGWLSDRWGRRPVIVGSLLLYALLFPLYALPMPPEALIGLRFVQALVGGAYLPASLALAADLTPVERRGRIFSQLRASDAAGVLIGPVVGGAVAGLRLDYVFFAGAVICASAALVLLRLPAASILAAGGGDAEERRPVRPLRLLWLLLPVIALGAPVMWTFGAYDTVWPLYLTSRGANTFLVGLSYGTYALPILLFAGLAGGLADRLGPMRAGTLSLLTFGLLASLYPLVASVPALILIGFAEGTLTAAGIPALNAEISRRAPAGAQGRTQGLYQLALNATQVLGAVASGALYGLRPPYAFYGVTSVCLIGVAASLVLRRVQDQGGASSEARTSVQR